MSNEEFLEKVRELTRDKKGGSCPSCGRCSECGHTPWNTQPYYPRPYWVGVPYWSTTPPYTITSTPSSGTGWTYVSGNTGTSVSVFGNSA